MTKLEQIFNKDNLNHFNNIKKLEELKKIDYHFDIYIRNHTKILLSVPGATEMSVATLIINRISNIINNDELILNDTTKDSNISNKIEVI